MADYLAHVYWLRPVRWAGTETGGDCGRRRLRCTGRAVAPRCVVLARPPVALGRGPGRRQLAPSP